MSAGQLGGVSGKAHARNPWAPNPGDEGGGEQQRAAVTSQQQGTPRWATEVSQRVAALGAVSRGNTARGGGGVVR